VRTRHTSRTDPLMQTDRKQVSYRLSSHYRARIKEALGELKGTGVYIENESDIFQDMVFLWFYEFDRSRNGMATGAGQAGHSVGLAVSGEGEDTAGVEVGEAS